MCSIPKRVEIINSYDRGAVFISSSPFNVRQRENERDNRRSIVTAVWQNSCWADGEYPADCHRNVECCHDRA